MFFFFNDTATTEIYTLSLNDALPIYPSKNQKYIRKSSKLKKNKKTKKKAKPYFSQYGHWSAVHDSMFSYIQVKDNEWVGRELNLVEAIITGLKKDGEILKKAERLINQEDIYFTPQLIKYFNSIRSEEHTSELQSRRNLVCRLLLEKKKKRTNKHKLHTK